MWGAWGRAGGLGVSNRQRQARTSAVILTIDVTSSVPIDGEALRNLEFYPHSNYASCTLCV